MSDRAATSPAKNQEETIIFSKTTAEGIVGINDLSAVQHYNEDDSFESSFQQTQDHAPTTSAPTDMDVETNASFYAKEVQEDSSTLETQPEQTVVTASDKSPVNQSVVMGEVPPMDEPLQYNDEDQSTESGDDTCKPAVNDNPTSTTQQDDDDVAHQEADDTSTLPSTESPFIQVQQQRRRAPRGLPRTAKPAE